MDAHFSPASHEKPFAFILLNMFFLPPCWSKIIFLFQLQWKIFCRFSLYMHLLAVNFEFACPEQPRLLKFELYFAEYLEVTFFFFQLFKTCHWLLSCIAYAMSTCHFIFFCNAYVSIVPSRFSVTLLNKNVNLICIYALCCSYISRWYLSSFELLLLCH